MKQPAKAPMPGEWHSWYDDKRQWLQAWLDGSPPYDRVHVPAPPRLSLMAEDDGPLVPELEKVTLVKAKCAGWAPYVGRPFAYVWDAAYDDYGRCIASEARLEYTMSEIESQMWGLSE